MSSFLNEFLLHGWGLGPLRRHRTDGEPQSLLEVFFIRKVPPKKICWFNSIHMHMHLPSCHLQFRGHKHWWWASLVAQTVKNLPAVQETWVQSLGWEDPLEDSMATHSSILAWSIPWTEEPGRLQSMGLQRVGDGWVTEHSINIDGKNPLLLSLTYN